eukprot:TCONS_00070771-protein
MFYFNILAILLLLYFFKGAIGLDCYMCSYYEGYQLPHPGCKALVDTKNLTKSCSDDEVCQSMFVFKRSEASQTEEDFYSGFNSVMRECRPRAKVACGDKKDERWYNCTHRPLTDGKVTECFACCEEGRCGAKVELFKDEWSPTDKDKDKGAGEGEGPSPTVIALAVVIPAVVLLAVAVAWKKKLYQRVSNCNN